MTKKENMQRRKSTSLERIAFHEAGHAVASCVLHRRFSHVSIEPDAEGLSLGGLVRRRRTSHPAFREHGGKFYPWRESRSVIKRDIMISLAGSIAETIFSKGEAMIRLDSPDYEKALSLATDNLPTNKTPEKHVDSLAIKSFFIIQDLNWPAVESLAAALLEKKRIRFMEARKIISMAMERNWDIRQ